MNYTMHQDTNHCPACCGGCAGTQHICGTTQHPMNNIKSVEEIVKEYREFFLQEIPADEQTPGFVLYCSRCNGGEEFDNWLRNTITQDRQDILNAVVEGLEEKKQWVSKIHLNRGDEYMLDRTMKNDVIDQAITLVTELLEDKTN